jgi:hypothetical protein
MSAVGDCHSFLTLVCRHPGRHASPERLALDFEG